MQIKRRTLKFLGQNEPLGHIYSGTSSPRVHRERSSQSCSCENGDWIGYIFQYFKSLYSLPPPLKFSKELLILCRSLNWRNEHCVARMSCMIMIWQFSFEIQILIYGTTERILDTSNNISYRNDLNTWGHAGPNFVAFNIRGLQLSFSTGGAKRRLSTGASA